MLARKLLSKTQSGDPGIEYIGARESSSTTTVTTVYYPAGTSRGDLVVGIISTGKYARSWTISSLTYTTIVATHAGQNTSAFLFWLIAGGESSMSFSTSSNSNQAVVIKVFRNAEYSKSSDSGEIYDDTPPSSISTTEGSVVIVAFGTDGYAGTVSGPDGYDNLEDYFNSGTDGTTTMMNHKEITSDGVESPGFIVFPGSNPRMFGSTIEITYKE